MVQKGLLKTNDALRAVSAQTVLGFLIIINLKVTLTSSNWVEMFLADCWRAILVLQDSLVQYRPLNLQVLWSSIFQSRKSQHLTTESSQLSYAEFAEQK